MITEVEPMSGGRVRALEMAYELLELLEELKERPEHGPGSCVEQACDDMCDVVAMLEPCEPDDDDYRQPTRDERRAAYRKVHGAEPPPGWPPPQVPRLRVVTGKDEQP